MGARGSGRRAEGEAALVLMPSKPLPPPKAVNAEARKIWRATVASVPSGFFTAADVPLLTVFVVHAELHARVTAIIDAEGPLVKLGKSETLAVHPAVRIQSLAAGVMNATGTKLRLSKSARTPRDAASTEMNRPRTARKPWNMK